MSNFDSNGNYNKTEWKNDDLITADKLNKIEDAIQTVNKNDIERHKEADGRLDELEQNEKVIEEELNNKATKEHTHDEYLTEHQDISNLATKEELNQGKADMEAMVAEVEGDVSLLKNVNRICNDDIHAFFDEIDDDAYVTIPYINGGWKITSPINIYNKRLTIDIQGDIYDRIVDLPTPSNNVDINGRGLFSFENCEVSIIQRPGTLINGGKGVQGLSGSPRNIFYFYNCPQVTTEGLNTKNATLHPVASVGCSNITETNGIHRNCECVVHVSCDYVKLNNITVFDSLYNGITVLNRGIISEGDGFYHKRPRFVDVSNCRVYGVTSNNSYAVGITIDMCDYITCNDNIVDLQNAGTMAYSFADSTTGTVTGNIALNCWNPTNGTYKYCGVGMECERIRDINFSGNIFIDCLMGYLINNSENISVDGQYDITDMESSIPTGMSSGNPAYVTLVGGNVLSNTNIKISGIIKNTPSSVQIGGKQNSIYIDNLICSNYKNRNINIYGSINKLVISNCDFNAYNENSGVVINVGLECVSKLYIENVKAKHFATNHFIQGYNTTGELYMKNVYVDSFDKVCHFTSSWKNMGIQFLDCFNVNSATESQGSNTYYISDVRIDGKLQHERGEVKTLWRNAPPVNGIDKGYRGQKWIDGVNKKEYTYMDGWIEIN